MRERVPFIKSGGSGYKASVSLGFSCMRLTAWKYILNGLDMDVCIWFFLFMSVLSVCFLSSMILKTALSCSFNLLLVWANFAIYDCFIDSVSLSAQLHNYSPSRLILWNCRAYMRQLQLYSIRMGCFSFFLCVWLFGMPKLAFLVISWFCFCDMQLFFSGSPVARQCAERRIAEVVHVWASAQKRKVFLLVSVKRKDEGILPVQRGALLAGAAGAWLLYQKPGT